MKFYNYFLIAIFLVFSTNSFSQVDTVSNIVPDTSTSHTNTDKIYHLNLPVDIPVTVLCGVWSGYAFTVIYNKDRSTEQQILDLDKNDIPKIDRWAAGMSDENADIASDYLFYGSIPYAFTMLLSKEIRQEAGKIGLLYLEAMCVTGLFYTGTAYFVDRYRPETYDTEVPLDERTSGNMKNAFLAGHPALVATSTFFTASIFSSYYPKSAVSYTAYGVAIAATGTTVYLRHIAGKHFPTDLATGVTLGTLSGLLVPRLHRDKIDKDQKLGFYPFAPGTSSGITAVYRF